MGRSGVGERMLQGRPESDVGMEDRVRWAGLTFVLSSCGGLRAHGTAHEHPVTPVESLIYQGHPYKIKEHGPRQLFPWHPHGLPSADHCSPLLQGPQVDPSQPPGFLSTLRSPGEISECFGKPQAKDPGYGPLGFMYS